MPVVLTDGRAVGRWTVTWVPNCLGWVVYHIFLPMVLRCARFARKSSAINYNLPSGVLLPFLFWMTSPFPEKNKRMIARYISHTITCYDVQKIKNNAKTRDKIREIYNCTIYNSQCWPSQVVSLQLQLCQGVPYFTFDHFLPRPICFTQSHEILHILLPGN